MDPLQKKKEKVKLFIAKTNNQVSDYLEKALNEEEENLIWANYMNTLTDGIFEILEITE